MSMKPHAIALMLASSQLAACSSIMTHLDNSDKSYYPGTRSVIRHFSSPHTSWVMWPFLVVDLPTSALLDTLLLPYDYYRINDSVSAEMPHNSTIVPQSSGSLSMPADNKAADSH